MDKLLTISIAAYNVESTLEDALSPFCECENKDKLEVLIIDDGSKDETAEIGKEYERQHPDIFRVISKKMVDGVQHLMLEFKKEREDILSS